MTRDPSRHFDAPRTGSIAGAAAPLLRSRWQVFAALIVTVTILQAMAFGLVGIDAIGSARIDASFASVAIYVAAETEASAAEVDALGPLIRAVPGISGATLRSKDDAIKSLVANGLPPPDGRNPLADVWIVRMQAGSEPNGGSVATTWKEKRQALLPLPRVASVSTDERWVAALDRGVTRWRTQWPVALSGGLAVLALAGIGVAYLAGCGLATPSGSDTKRDTRVQVLAFVAALAGLVTTVFAYVTAWLFLDRLSEALSATGWPFGQLFAMRPLLSGSIVVALVLVLVGNFVLGARNSG